MITAVEASPSAGPGPSAAARPVPMPATPTVTSRLAPAGRFGELPYGPGLNHLIERSHGAWVALSDWFSVPLIKAGLAPLLVNPFTGSWVLLRTTGRRSGRVREAALGYAVLDGCVYVCAGFGPRTRWFLNLQANPRVEFVLPQGAYAGLGEEVTERAELLRAWRPYLQALGQLGTRLVADPARTSDEALLAASENLPLVRLRPTGIGSGPADPGGLFWVTITALGTWWLLGRFRRRDR